MEKTVCCVILERDQSLREKVEDSLSARGYLVECCSKAEDLYGLLKSRAVSLVVLGEGEEVGDFFYPLKMTVRLSPMTSVILLTDLTEAQVHEKAEGYGILGAVSRRDPSADLVPLCKRFQEIESIMAISRSRD